MRRERFFFLFFFINLKTINIGCDKLSKWEDIFDSWTKSEKSSEENDENKQIHIHDNTINVYFCSESIDKTKKDITKSKSTQTSTKINTQQLRNNPKMKKWKKKIKSLDEGSCQCCSERVEKDLQIHHIMPLKDYPELVIDEGNGIALCKKCHNKYHEMYKDNENAANFAKFMRDYANRIYR